MDLEAIAQVDMVDLTMNRRSSLPFYPQRNRQSGTENEWIEVDNRRLPRDRGRGKGTCYILRGMVGALEMRVFIPGKAGRGVVRRLVMRQGPRRSKV